MVLVIVMPANSGVLEWIEGVSQEAGSVALGAVSYACLVIAAFIS